MHSGYAGGAGPRPAAGAAGAHVDAPVHVGTFVSMIVISVLATGGDIAKRTAVARSRETLSVVLHLHTSFAADLSVTNNSVHPAQTP